jgi:hypothetical protein
MALSDGASTGQVDIVLPPRFPSTPLNIIEAIITLSAFIITV